MDLNTQENSSTKSGKGSFFSELQKMFSVKGLIKNDVAYINEKDEIIASIKNAKSDWINATKNFEYARDAGMIDYYTYEIKACEVRYQYFLIKAKEKGIKIDTPEGIR